jgi:hypothetical protein
VILLEVLKRAGDRGFQSPVCPQWNLLTCAQLRLVPTAQCVVVAPIIVAVSSLETCIKHVNYISNSWSRNKMNGFGAIMGQHALIERSAQLPRLEGGARCAARTVGLARKVLYWDSSHVRKSVRERLYDDVLLSE